MFGDQNLKPCFLSLPIRESPTALEPVSDLWVRSLGGKTPAEIHKELVARWKPIENTYLEMLADLVLESPVQSLVIYDHHAWLHLGEEQIDDFPSWFVAPTLPAESIESDLDRYVYDSFTREQLTFFLRHFAGLRESRPGLAGSFADIPSIGMMERYGDYLDDPDAEFGQLANAIVLFSDIGGNGLGLCPNGETGWYIFDTAEVDNTYVSTLERVVVEYVRFRKRSLTPFDYYAAVEQLRQG